MDGTNSAIVWLLLLWLVAGQPRKRFAPWYWTRTGLLVCLWLILACQVIIDTCTALLWVIRHAGY